MTFTCPPVPVPNSAGKLLDSTRNSARLQLERRRYLAVQVARRGVDDRRALDAVVADHVLLDGAAREADLLPRAAARVLGAGGLQHQLRHLAAVDRQRLHLGFVDVDTLTGRAQIDDVRLRRHDNRLGQAGRLELQIEFEILRGDELELGELERRELSEPRAKGVARRLQVRDHIPAIGVGRGHALFAGALVLRRDGGARNDRSCLVEHRSREPCVALCQDQ
jgi:hypothetical protein